MVMGRGGVEGWGLRPCPAWFCLNPCPHDGENFFTPSPPLEALRSPASSHKTLLFVNLLTTSTIFFNETYFINKNILEITTKFIPSNQFNF